MWVDVLVASSLNPIAHVCEVYRGSVGIRKMMGYLCAHVYIIYVYDGEVGMRLWNLLHLLLQSCSKYI